MPKIEHTRRPSEGAACVDERFLDRWSPRAFANTALTKEQVATLLEAARWAPSAYNEQPWHIVYAADEKALSKFRPIILDGNRRWSDRAPFLAVVFAKKRFSHNDKKNRLAQFDCGAAWMSLALQARDMGLYAHGMAGFDRDKAYEVLQVSKDDYTAVAAIAVGHYGDSSLLPEDLQKIEQPNERNEVGSWARPVKC